MDVFLKQKPFRKNKVYYSAHFISKLLAINKILIVFVQLKFTAAFYKLIAKNLIQNQVNAKTKKQKQKKIPFQIHR